MEDCVKHVLNGNLTVLHALHTILALFVTQDLLLMLVLVVDVIQGNIYQVLLV